MALTAIPIERWEQIGLGVRRPEDVVVSAAGEVWMSDQASACAMLCADGSLRRVGVAGGAPSTASTWIVRVAS